MVDSGFGYDFTEFFFYIFGPFSLLRFRDPVFHEIFMVLCCFFLLDLTDFRIVSLIFWVLLWMIGGFLRHFFRGRSPFFFFVDLSFVDGFSFIFPKNWPPSFELLATTAALIRFAFTEFF